MYGSNKRACGNFATLINKQHSQLFDSMILNPGPVSTGMIGYSKNQYTTTSPEETILSALKDFGYLFTSNGSQIHSAFGVQVSYTPEWVRNMQRKAMGGADPVGSYKPYIVL